MAAIIRSTVLAVNVDGASRDDLVVGTPVTLNSLGAASTWSWIIAYAPEGSAATFTGDPATASPGTFTPDLEGAYLIRLVTDAGTAGEDSQYVRLRVITDFAALKLVAAGERRDGTGIVPVDVGATGWADEQNFNLQTLEGIIEDRTRFWRDTLVNTQTCTDIETTKAVGQFRLSGSDLPAGLSYRISFVHWVTDVALTGSFEGTWTLYDLTNAEACATATTTSTSPTAGTVALTLGNGVGEIKDAATIYEVRLSTMNGSGFDVYGVGSIVLEGV